MMDEVDEKHKEAVEHNGSSPLLVHCRSLLPLFILFHFILFYFIYHIFVYSAGIGRTGTYVVVHSVSKMLKEKRIDNIDGLNLQPILSKMRDQVHNFFSFIFFSWQLSLIRLIFLKKSSIFLFFLYFYSFILCFVGFTFFNFLVFLFDFFLTFLILFCVLFVCLTWIPSGQGSFSKRRNISSATKPFIRN